jgi:hypothetical protein
MSDEVILRISYLQRKVALVNSYVSGRPIKYFPFMVVNCSHAAPLMQCWSITLRSSLQFKDTLHVKVYIIIERKISQAITTFIYITWETVT